MSHEGKSYTEKLEQEIDRLTEERNRLSVIVDRLHTPQSGLVWHEDDGNVLWWLMPIEEPPYLGTPLDYGWPWGDLDMGSVWWVPLPDCDEIDGRYQAEIMKEHQ